MEASTPVLKISVKSVKKINIDDCLPNASDSSSDWSNHSVNLSIKEEIDELSPVLKQTHISNSPAKIEYGLDGSSMPLQTRKRSRMEKWDYNQESREITGLICTLTTAVTVPLSVTWGDAECDMCNTEQMTEE